MATNLTIELFFPVFFFSFEGGGGVPLHLGTLQKQGKQQRPPPQGPCDSLLPGGTEHFRVGWILVCLFCMVLRSVYGSWTSHGVENHGHAVLRAQGTFGYGCMSVVG